MKACIFGGHYGSEGKGSFSEFLFRERLDVLKRNNRLLIAFGENSPNSGHTNSLGKTRNIPVSSLFADAVILGPDSVIDLDCLAVDIQLLKTINPVPIYIHENAAVVSQSHPALEASLVQRISSTGTGSGAARYDKCFYRYTSAVFSHYGYGLNLGINYPIISLSTSHYFNLIEKIQDEDWLFECSQGTLLDVNFGRFPYVTSRSTLPRVAIERNGLGAYPWEYFGVYRTYPIRTGGPSGPTGGEEITFKDLNVEPEIATVTSRQRRIFRFDRNDFLTSLKLTRPEAIAFTHLDYLYPGSYSHQEFYNWLLKNYDIHPSYLKELGVGTLYLSHKLSKFTSSFTDDYKLMTK